MAGAALSSRRHQNGCGYGVSVVEIDGAPGWRRLGKTNPNEDKHFQAGAGRAAGG
jgi:hypothetical protein